MRLLKHATPKLNRRIINNLIALASLQGLNFIIPLITLPYLLRVIGLEKFGLINLAIAFSMFFGAVIQYGFSLSSTRDIAKSSSTHEEVQRLFNLSLFSSLYLALILAPVALLTILSIERFREDTMFFSLTYLSICLQSLFPIWYFQGIEKMKNIAILHLIGKILNLSLLLLLVKDATNYIIIPMINIVCDATVLSLALLICKVNYRIQFSPPPIGVFIKFLKEKNHAFYYQFMPNLYNNSTPLLLGLVAGDYILGIFSAANRLINAASSLAYIIGNAFLPQLSRNLNQHSVFRKIMLTLGITLPIAICIASGLIVLLIYGKNDQTLQMTLIALSPCIFLVFYQVTHANNFLMLCENEDYVRKTVFKSSIFSFAISVPLIFVFNLYGAIATLIFPRIISSAYFGSRYKRLINKI